MTSSNTIAQAAIAAAQRLSQQVEAMRFAAPVTHVYNPLTYAWATHEIYLRRFAASKKKVVFVGMNPGPFGMVQTGVPFGEVAAVRDWMGIEAEENVVGATCGRPQKFRRPQVAPTPSSFSENEGTDSNQKGFSVFIKKPKHENPKRPIEGFACSRSEVSGRRLWGLFAQRFGTAEHFFQNHFVANYCPLAFFDGGRNLTPDKLPSAEQAPLLATCDAHLRALIELLQPQWVIGIGAWAETRARVALAGLPEIRVGCILHPSPASPAANRGWSDAATRQLVELGVWEEE
ncbi:MAG: single-stranded DNA-binding protein [Burkholderiales bacterium]|jgi:single-strand selective monofunctional uracil DNA glycosylase|nr:single-stranded DNA-binding protein [Burkholderiales bacterium]